MIKVLRDKQDAVKSRSLPSRNEHEAKDTSNNEEELLWLLSQEWITKAFIPHKCFLKPFVSV